MQITKAHLYMQNNSVIAAFFRETKIWDMLFCSLSDTAYFNTLRVSLRYIHTSISA